MAHTLPVNMKQQQADTAVLRETIIINRQPYSGEW